MSVTITNNTKLFPGHTLGEWSNDYAFAVIKADGSVVTWGDSNYGGYSGAVAAQLNGTIDVKQIYSTWKAFATLRSDGSVITWGDSNSGGNSSALQLSSMAPSMLRKSTRHPAPLPLCAAMARWSPGEIASYGGDSSAVAAQLGSGVVSGANIYTNDVFSAGNNHAPTGSVTIKGIASQGKILTAANTLADADGLGTIGYTWKTGATVLGSGNTYTLKAADVGKTLTVTASYIDGLGNKESVISAATGVVGISSSGYGSSGFAVWHIRQ